ncbi:MAG TPA: protein kinase [Fimbriimonadaceae bacterium]|nr:protein kinase [Fimbriimonadaceae bacterium]
MIGSVLRARYEILQEIGESAVFASYVAHDRVSEKSVVVRLLKGGYSQERPFVDRLRQVVEKSKAIDHPAVSKATDFDEDDGRWFIVYQYTPGQSLNERIRRATEMGVSTAVTTAAGVLEGLEAVHKAGLVHGEVSTRNVIVSRSGATTLLGPCVWEAYSASETAGVEMLPLLAPYLAPEVTAGETLSPASDVYAVGVLMYEILTGERPFRGRKPVELAMAHATSAIPRLRERVASAPEALEKIIEKALAKDRKERYRDAGEMLRDVRLLRDAMRFGRPLSWPLRPANAVQEPRVGPKLNVARVEHKEQKVAKKRAIDRSDGAPPWLVYTAFTLLSGAAVAVGWWMFFNLGAPRTLKVPNIVGTSFSEASAALDKMHLKLRKIKEQASEEYPEGVVLKVQPAVGREVKEFMFVDATVSSGSKFVEVPDLSGRTVEDARKLLKSVGLRLGANIQFVSSEDVQNGFIVSQRPSKHTQADRHSAVTIEVSSGPPIAEPQQTPPDNVFVYHLNWVMPDSANDIVVRVEMTDQVSTRTVYEETMSPNDEVNIDVDGTGDEATFMIYYDNKLVKTVKQHAGDQGDQTAPPPSDNGARWDLGDTGH